MKGFIRNRIHLIAVLIVFLLSGADGPNDSGAADCYYRSGKAKYHNGKFREAIEDYDRAAALSPGTAKIFGSRAAAKRKLGDRQGALDDARTAASLGDKDSQRILRMLGYDW
ncbi:tetratricopeptide repeat protein [Chlorobium sp.]|uniref:tetratricopeptide repeat protein n=1 Tax=Chlorobium sp. TaxID=1095 RepID=UPI002F3F767F